jgi:type IV pilus assembly protein PilO
MLTGLRGTILLAAIVGMPVASYFLVFRPQNNAINEARADVEYTRTLLNKLREETARNADLEKAIEEIRASVTAAETRLPSDKEIADVVRQVSDLAIQAGLEAPAMKSAKPVQAALYMEQPLDMSIKGDFRNFFLFLANVEKLPRIMRITDFKVVRDEKTDLETNAVVQDKVDFTLSIYFQPGKKRSAAATGEEF